MLKMPVISRYTIVATLFLTVVPWGIAAQGIASYRAVTDQRLGNPSTPHWLLYRATYDGWGFHPADLINTTNIKQLVPLWRFSTGESGGHQASPMVNAGVMFITTPRNQVVALNAFTGDLLWRYRRQLPADILPSYPTNRGVGLYEETVYLTTLDAHLVALDAKTGQVLWEKAVDDYAQGYYMTLAPLVAKGKVLVGMSGGEYGLRGYIAAFDGRTGDRVWKTYTIPGPGEPGHDSWAGESWRTGGASAAITGHYDPFLNLAYWGTGSVSPWPADAHHGDNLHASSVIALDVDTGEVNSRFQYHWNDSWGWDEVSAPLMIRMTRDGRTFDALVHAGRNGYLWRLERSGNTLTFVDAKPYVTQNVFTSLDPQTGRPVFDSKRRLVDGKTVSFCPSIWGGKHWPPAAYNPHTGYLYIPANENLCSTLTGRLTAHAHGKLFLGIDETATRLTVQEGATHIGELQAWDLRTMQRAWTQTFTSPNWGPVLVTAGGLVFMGGTHDRYFRAFDAKTGEKLWAFQTNSAVTGVPISYGKIGTQYIAVLSGWGGEPQQMQMQLDAALGTKTEVPQGGVLWVFGLPE
jgi:alcohol dehydrogenase (cytochrome c)